MTLSATCGGTWRASAKLPKQLHGRCHPMNHRAERYTAKLVAKNATSELVSAGLFLKKQAIAISVSKIPANSRRYLNGISNIGSSKYNIRSLPEKVITFAVPVTASKTPKENTNRFLDRSDVTIYKYAVVNLRKFQYKDKQYSRRLQASAPRAFHKSNRFHSIDMSR